MAQEFRIDSHRFDGRIRKDGRGFAVVPARVTRSGVFVYTRADGGKVRELRHPAEVFAPGHLASLEHAPVTIGHPPAHVSPSNVRALEVGIASDARRDGKFVSATLSVRDAAAIAKVERGELCELSLGYQLQIDPTPGEFEGERYDQRQVDLRVNHIALLPPGGGRAGRDVCLRFDSSSAELLALAATFHEGGSMSNELELRLDALERKYRDGLVKNGEQSLYDRDRMTVDERLDALERRLAAQGQPRKG
jgi:hypothetical protein